MCSLPLPHSPHSCRGPFSSIPWYLLGVINPSSLISLAILSHSHSLSLLYLAHFAFSHSLAFTLHHFCTPLSCLCSPCLLHCLSLQPPLHCTLSFAYLYALLCSCSFLSGPGPILLSPLAAFLPCPVLSALLWSSITSLLSPSLCESLCCTTSPSWKHY